MRRSVLKKLVPLWLVAITSSAAIGVGAAGYIERAERLTTDHELTCRIAKITHAQALYYENLDQILRHRGIAGDDSLVINVERVLHAMRGIHALARECTAAES